MSRTLANASAPERPATDFYPTPVQVTYALMEWLQLPERTLVWECACGEGMMARALKEYVAVESSDIIDRGYGMGVVDFLETLPPQGVRWVITNPPFIHSEAFIRHAATLKLDGFAFLLKSQYWHATKRHKLFLQYPPAAVLPLTWRPDFLHGAKNGAPTMEVLWTVWLRGQTKTIYCPLPRPAL